ncbi:MAG: urease accessory protein UreD [Pseudomonadota bacterium]
MAHPQLDLAYEQTQDGRTWLKTARARHPWWLARSFQGDAVDTTLTVIPQSATSVLMSGDRIVQRIIARRGTEARVVSAGSQVVHAARDNDTAKTFWQIIAHTDAALACIQHPTVLMPGAIFDQRIDLVVDPASRLVYSDGLTWHGPEEVPAFASVYSHTRILSPDGRALALERFDANAETITRETAASPRPIKVVGQLLVLGATDESLGSALSIALTDQDDAICGVGRLPNDAGWVVRILASSGSSFRACQEVAWRTASGFGSETNSAWLPRIGL